MSQLDPLVKITTAEAMPDGFLAELLTAAFTDYVAGPVQMDANSARRFLMAGRVEPTMSLVAMAGDLPVGFALVGRSVPCSRLASMGVVPGWRCRGVGHALLERFIHDARERADTGLDLEVFERNLPAVALYEHAGFKLRRRLLGWLRPAELPVPENDPSAAAEISREDFTALRPRTDFPDFPWQVSPLGASLLPDELRCFRLGATAVGVSGLGTAKTALRCLAADPAAGTGELTELLLSLAARFPGTALRVPAFWPEELAPAFRAASFSQAELSQLQMHLAL